MQSKLPLESPVIFKITCTNNLPKKAGLQCNYSTVSCVRQTVIRFNTSTQSNESQCSYNHYNNVFGETVLLSQPGFSEQNIIAPSSWSPFVAELLCLLYTVLFTQIACRIYASVTVSAEALVYRHFATVRKVADSTHTLIVSFHQK